MLKMIKNSLAVALIMLMAISASSAQGTAKPAASGDDFVTEKGFKSKVLEVKYRDASSLANVLRQLGSGFRGAAVSPSSEFKTITVRDFPENVATIEEALKRLDVPSPSRPNIELHMHVLIASNASGPTREVPAELKDVLTQLRGTFNYQKYELATSVIQRLTESRSDFRGKGTAEVGNTLGNPDTGMPYEYVIFSVQLIQNPTGAASVQIGQFSFTTLNDKDRAQVQTTLNIRDGEKVVVGTATMRDRALIVVLTAKLLN
ncbi:MAG: hypothetical protein QOE77_2997 [Blastocatellia bacterium]|jgi:hypothetical protein|nr:hypothetical protein [Blastocatellia bacterium]